MAMNILLALLLSPSGSNFGLIHLKPTIDIAFEAVNAAAASGQYYTNFTMSYELRELATSCSNPVLTASGIAADLFTGYPIAGFLGPPCSTATEAVSDLAGYWNLPVVSGVSTSSDLDNKVRHRTLTRVSYQTKGLVDSLFACLEFFQWRRVSLVWGSGIGSLVLSSVLGRSVTLDLDLHEFPLGSYESSAQALLEASIVSRSKFGIPSFIYSIYHSITLILSKTDR